MKTFETEKNNIPEGATHYMNQTSYSYFAWCRYVDDRLYVTLSGELDWTHVSEDIFDRNIKPIPQTKEVEWVNGDECDVWSSGEWHSGEHTFIGESKCKTKYVVCYNYLTNYVEFPMESVRKPETQEAKEHREQVESAYELHCDSCAIKGETKLSFDEFNHVDNSFEFAVWMHVVRKAGYRKESE